MKKAIFNKLGTKQLVDTGYKIFDNQTNYIGTGNVVANTMIGCYIRANWEGKAGVNFDINFFKIAGLRIPQALLDYFENELRPKSEILYCIFTRDKHGFKDVIGWILTTGHPEYKLVTTFYNYQSNKHNTKRLLAFQEVKNILLMIKNCNEQIKVML